MCYNFNGAQTAPCANTYAYFRCISVSEKNNTCSILEDVSLEVPAIYSESGVFAIDIPKAPYIVAYLGCISV